MNPDYWQELIEDLNSFEFKAALAGLAISLVSLATAFLLM
jgi:hypothetical protein